MKHLILFAFLTLSQLAFARTEFSFDPNMIKIKIGEAIFASYRCDAINKMTSLHELYSGDLRRTEETILRSHGRTRLTDELFRNRYHSYTLMSPTLLVGYSRAPLRGGELLRFLTELDRISARTGQANRLVLSEAAVHLVQPLVQQMSTRNQAYYTYVDEGRFDARLQMLFETALNTYNNDALTALGAIGETLYLVSESQRYAGVLTANRISAPFRFLDLGDNIQWLISDFSGDIQQQTNLHRSFWQNFNRTLINSGNILRFGMGVGADAPVTVRVDDQDLARKSAEWGSKMAEGVYAEVVRLKSADPECRRLACEAMRDNAFFQAATGGLSGLAGGNDCSRM